MEIETELKAHEGQILPPAKPWQWKKGVSGNPAGDTREKQRVLKYARGRGMKAVQMLYQIMNEPKAGFSVRAMCALAILDRGFGKPKQEIAVEDRGRSLEEMLLAIYDARSEAAQVIENASENP